MNKAQFKRLAGVLLIPLLIFGWWAADAELFLDHHVRTDCSVRDEHVSCYSTHVSQRKLVDYEIDAGGIYLWTGARLDDGLHEDIVTTGIDGTYVGAGVAKKLNIAANVGANSLLRCYLSDYGVWVLRCFGNNPEYFRFASDSVDQKFRNLARVATEEKSKMDQYSRNRYLLSVFIPISAFLLLSVVVLMLVKVFSFVKYGRPGKREE